MFQMFKDISVTCHDTSVSFILFILNVIPCNVNVNTQVYNSTLFLPPLSKSTIIIGVYLWYLLIYLPLPDKCTN